MVPYTVYYSVLAVLHGNTEPVFISTETMSPLYGGAGTNLKVGAPVRR